MKRFVLWLALLCVTIPAFAAPASGWIVQSGHKTDSFGEGVAAMKWSPDGALLASATALTGELLIRNRAGQIWARQVGLPRINDLDWSGDSQFLALATDSEIKIWGRDVADFISPDASQSWILKEGAPSRIGFLSDNRLAIYFESDDKVKKPALWIWNFRSGEKVRVADDFSDPWLRGFAVAPDRESFAVSSDAALQIYGADGASRASFPTTKNDNEMFFGVEKLRFSPDGKWLAGYELNSNRWKKWDLKARKASGGGAISGYESPKDYALDANGAIAWLLRDEKNATVFERFQNGKWNQTKVQTAVIGDASPDIFAFDANATRAAIATVWGDVAAFDTASGRALWLGRNANQWANAVNFSPDSARLVVGYGQRDGDGASGELAVFGLADSRLLRGLTAHFDQSGTDYGVSDAQFSPDGKWLVSTGDLNDGTAGLCVFEAQSLSRVRNIALLTDRAAKIAWSTDGQSLAVGTDGGEVSLWKNFERAAKGKINPDWAVKLGASPSKNQSSLDSFDQNIVLALAVSPDKGYIVAGRDARICAILDYATGKTLRTLRLGAKPVGVVWARDGKRLWTAAQNGQILEWSAPDFQIVRTLSTGGADDYCGALALSFDGLILYAGRSDAAAAFDATSGQFLRELRGVGAYFNALSISSDGNWVAGASENGQAALWNARNGELARVFHRVSARRDAKGALKTEAVALGDDGQLRARTSEKVVLWRQGENLLGEKPD